MSGASKGVAWFFGGAGVLMVLIGSELKDRGAELGAAASVCVLIGMIWTVVAIGLAVLFLVIRRA